MTRARVWTEAIVDTSAVMVADLLLLFLRRSCCCASELWVVECTNDRRPATKQQPPCVYNNMGVRSCAKWMVRAKGQQC